ncbi:hypothetical protein NTHI1209_00949 [Haemophilus influenzae]|uniref:Uncharacterized protein n=1 Tax=Haemophilus influenzae TaxID=727 RepID=A0A158SWU9_HAEIF|nr:hypothetical protein NTHI1209_00949 [Haemophilus influenzae]
MINNKIKSTTSFLLVVFFYGKCGKFLRCFYVGFFVIPITISCKTT